MSEPTEFQTGGVKNKPKRNFGKLVVVLIFLLILCALLHKPVSIQICDWTYICFYTCDTYHADYSEQNYPPLFGLHVSEKHRCQYKEEQRKNHVTRVFKDILG